MLNQDVIAANRTHHHRTRPEITRYRRNISSALCSSDGNAVLATHSQVSRVAAIDRTKPDTRMPTRNAVVHFPRTDLLSSGGHSGTKSGLDVVYIFDHGSQQ